MNRTLRSLSHAICSVAAVAVLSFSLLAGCLDGAGSEVDDMVLTAEAVDDSGARHGAETIAAGALDTEVASETPAIVGPTLDQAVDCGRKGAAGGVNGGDGLYRYDIDLDAFPEALCNDGTGAIMYVRQASTQAASDRWLIRLQGGGGCRSPEACLARWCSAGTNFGMDKMTTTLAPARGINSPGVHARRADNPFSNWNHVFVYYCSSDNWSGQAGAVDTSATTPDGQGVPFSVHFNGANIFDAVISSLKREHGAAVTYADRSSQGRRLPDLDDATAVVLSGASAGGGGVINNLDRLADSLPEVDVIGLIDSSWGPRLSALGFDDSTFCIDSGLCDYETFQTAMAATVNAGFWQARNDDSCVSWHEAEALGSSWRCTDNGEVLPNHLTTPFFVRMGLNDSLISGNVIEMGLYGPDPDDAPYDLAMFADTVRAQLDGLADIQQTAHEGGAIDVIPGWFGPGCPKHETLGNNPALYDTTIASSAGDLTMFEVMQRWLSSPGPTGLVAADLGTGCP